MDFADFMLPAIYPGQWTLPMGTATVTAGRSSRYVGRTHSATHTTDAVYRLQEKGWSGFCVERYVPCVCWNADADWNAIPDS